MNLLRRLVIGVSAVVSTAVLGVGGMAVMSLRDEVISLSDAQVSHSLSAFGYSYAKARKGEPITFPGQAPGTVVAVFSDGVPVLSASITEGDLGAAPEDALGALSALDWKSGDSRTVDLGSLGPHRVGTRDLGGGQRLVSAVSLHDAHQTLSLIHI